MEELVLERDLIKQKLIRLRDFFDNIDQSHLNDSILSDLSTRLLRFETCLDDFEHVQGNIERVAKKIDSDERAAFETSYFKLIGDIKALQNSYNTSVVYIGDEQRSVHSAQSMRVTSSNNNVQLPKIKLPTFDGQYENWPEYRDSFLALVDANTCIPDVQKFIYLRSTLEKEPSQVIKALEVSDENYQYAWQLIVGRYENKGLMIHNHLQAIFDHPGLTKESHSGLRGLLDHFNKHLRSLKTLGEQTDAWDRIIIFMIARKFDLATRKDWEAYKCENELPSMRDMINFLRVKCEILEKIESSAQTPVSKGKKSYTNSFVSNINTTRNCYYCSKNHPIYNCHEFLNLSIGDRISAVKKSKVCFNCLRGNHSSWVCRSQKCTKCGKPHNTLLHLETNGNNGNIISQTMVHTENHSTKVGGEAGSSSHEMTPATSLTHSLLKQPEDRSECSQALLATAIILVKVHDKLFPCRALMDAGSQSNFVSERFHKKLNLPSVRVNHIVKGVGQALANINKQINIDIKSTNNDFNMNINCLIIPKITDRLPIASFSKNILGLPHIYKLADPDFNISSEIDILLGSHVFWTALCAGHKQLGKNMPVLQETQFGWVIGGNLSSNSTAAYSLNHFATDCDITINNSVQKFWEIEDINSERKPLSKSEQYCENYFTDTTRRDPNSGKFIVRIPFKESLKSLGNSREMAVRRFYSLEQKIQRDSELKSDYKKFMTEYENLNHMSDITNKENTCSSNFYLPHHAVIKNTSITTKCRVVFDASAKTDTGHSLNDVQFSGPTLQNDIFSILLRFRKYSIVVTADVSKMYRQVLIDQDHKTYQRIFWRGEPSAPLKCYQLNTVTYGTASAPYLAIRCLLQLAYEHEATFPVACKIIKHDFYVDDLLTGAETPEEVLQIQGQVSQILEKGGFELRKWLCNDKTLLNNFKVNNDLDVGLLIGANEQNKTLGIYWNSNQDTIQYVINKNENIKTVTKRAILATICQIYDPLGLLGPVIIVAKMIIQELWKQNIPWDSPIPEDLYREWSSYKNALSEINNIKIPRHVVSSNHKNIELHGFSDASERAYGACIYVRCVTRDGRFDSKLLCAKSRVAPLKQLSLPRLELCAAVLLAHLMKKTVDSIDINFHRFYLWTDSTVTLAWIRGACNRWKTFVANRVSQIQSLTNSDNWHHIKSSDNPADLLSRGTNSHYLIDSDLWWRGPSWLLTDKTNWVVDSVETSFDIPEQRSVAHVSITPSSDSLNLINKFSNLKRVQRVMAHVLRYINNSKSPKDKRLSRHLTPEELKSSLETLIKGVQIECFNKDYINLTNNKELHHKSKLLSLNPFIHNGLIRVGGRIINSNQSFDSKHQILLPHSHKLTDLILENAHKEYLHCGANALLCNIRERFWPISGRNACKRIVRQCIVCFKAKPSAGKYLMGNLPGIRVNPSSPFLNVGVDFGGPFQLKDRKTRGARIIKGYMSLFICMGTKAVHLECVSELTTAAFIAALQRFISRRGRPANIYSDNGLNFVGARNELADISSFLKTNSDYIAGQLANGYDINWHFIPAASPSFGGIWEAGIKSAKYHLKRVVGSNTLTFEEFNTVLVRIEGILNSRPLCPLSSDPSDLTTLTPSHFLIGRSLVALPEVDVTDIKENRLDRFQLLQSMVQHYWSRWQKEYLAELQTRTRWKQRAAQSLKVGALALIKNDNVPVLNWQLGRITKLHPGKDGITRVVELKVSGGGEIKRAVNRICVLPID